MHLQLWYLPTIILLCFWQYYNHEQNQVFDNLKKFSSIGISQTEPFVNSELEINFIIESFLFLFFVFSFFSNTNFTEKNCKRDSNQNRRWPRDHHHVSNI